MSEQDRESNGEAGRAMRRFDVCNGDADGLCSVVQWRLHEPVPAVLVTGLKREIALLDRVDAGAGDSVLVCDLSMERNREALVRLLRRGATVRYFDHHAACDVPRHPALHAHLDTASGVCTSLLVDRHLQGAYRAWAIVGAFGDSLREAAGRLAAGMGLDDADTQRLRTLGEAINYNAYGDDAADVHITPQRLYERLVRYADPLEFLERESVAHEIDALRRADLARALAWPAHRESPRAAVRVLPPADWSARVIGSLANELAIAKPERANAVARPARDGGYVVSVRAPLASPHGASDFCRRFGGAGRAAAGGIDRLRADELDDFVEAFLQAHWGGEAHEQEREPGRK